ncbi:helix-turn-helix domain-containing protein [Pseudomonas avellanae]|nr:helix-turn-helix domain-containing protein [Pseudomonas avellanae]
MPSSSTIGSPVTNKPGQWVQTERKAHVDWATLIGRKPKAAMLLHHLVAHMGHQNAVVISQKTLSKIMKCSLRTIQYAIADLTSEKWVQIVRMNGPGTVAAYVVNDRVAWGQPRDQLCLSVFSAAVVADIEDQDTTTLEHDTLRRIPSLFPGERQLPSGQGSELPAQPALEGLEHDLPATGLLPNTSDNE